MEISIGSYKFRLEILILIVVVSWIMFGHLLCGCSRVGLLEGMEIMKEGLNNNIGSKSQNMIKAMKAKKDADDAAKVAEKAKKDADDAANVAEQAKKDADKKAQDAKKYTYTTKEGFVGANNMASGPEFAEAHSPDYIMHPSSWSMPTLTYSPGATPGAGVQSIWDRPKQPIPLPEGQLDMFANTEFKPECCPSAYSSSTGCACATVEQFNYLRERGGNNVPFNSY